MPAALTTASFSGRAASCSSRCHSGCKCHQTGVGGQFPFTGWRSCSSSPLDGRKARDRCLDCRRPGRYTRRLRGPARVCVLRARGLRAGATGAEGGLRSPGSHKRRQRAVCGVVRKNAALCPSARSAFYPGTKFAYARNQSINFTKTGFSAARRTESRLSLRSSDAGDTWA